MTEKVTSIYIHIPYCISKCTYCDFFSLPQRPEIPDNYIKALCNEIKYRIKKLNIRELKTIYIGGGTPSLLSENQLQKIFSTIKSSCSLHSEAEITVEVNPDDVTEKLLEGLWNCGVNRLSCGIQSMNDAALKKACRRADSAINRKALSLIKENWRGDTSYDLISGLPGDNEKGLLASLEEIISYNPSHISLYSLTIEEKTPFGRQLEAGLLDYDFDFADKLWLTGRDFLESRDYQWYEVSNFCRKGKECAHNLVYWTHGDYTACGSAACGTLYNEDGSGIRWTNTTNVEEYISFWEPVSEQPAEALSLPQDFEIIDKETSEFEFFMMGLRKLQGIKATDYESIFGERLPEKFLRLFEDWEKKGLCARRLCEDGDEFYAMSREGMLYLNRFNMELL